MYQDAKSKKITLKFTIGCPIFLIVDCGLNIEIEPGECRVSVLFSVILICRNISYNNMKCKNNIFFF
jgi:hypothetical protein